MENKAHALIAGLFTVALLIAALLGVMWFNSDRVERIPYEIATKLSVPGLNPQADVRYRGLDAGKVDSITFDPKVPGQILIRIKINPDTPMTQSTFATLGYQGVTGIAYIQLDDDGSKPLKLDSSKQHLARIELRPSLFDNLQTKGAVILARASEMSINSTACWTRKIRKPCSKRSAMSARPPTNTGPFRSSCSRPCASCRP